MKSGPKEKSSKDRSKGPRSASTEEEPKAVDEKKAPEKSPDSDVSEAEAAATDDAAPQGRESFGEWLRRQREARDIDLREIADASKVSLRYFQALEEDRFNVLPAPVFTKGFLRQYAAYVGLDAEETLNFYHSARLAQEPDEEPEIVSRPTASNPWPAILAILVALLLGAALLWWLGRLSNGAPTTAETRAPVSQSASSAEPATFSKPASTPAVAGSPSGDAPGDVAAETDASPDGNPPNPDAAAAEPPVTDDADADSETALVDVADAAPVSADEDLIVVLDFLGDCWVEASVDGTPQVAKLHTQGESLRLDGRENIEIKVGNATMVEVEVNGTAWPLETGEGRSVTRRFRIDRDAVNELRRRTSS